MLSRTRNYTELCDNFTWRIPEYYNIGVDICDRHAANTPDNIAIIDIDQSGTAVEYAYAQLRTRSNQLANALRSAGVSHESTPFADRVAVLLPQQVETAVAHIAIAKLGCIAVPLFTLFGEEALLHRLKDSAAKAIVTDEQGVQKLNKLRDKLPDLSFIVSVNGAQELAKDFATICSEQSPDFSAVETRADDPALLLYTSGTTGNPKGALHAHRVLLGHLPGVEMAFNFIPTEHDRFWTPADWAWIGGLLDVLMPAMHHGVPVVAYRFPKFDAAKALQLMKRHRIRNVFLPPTAMKLMRNVDYAETFNLRLRSVASGGETLGVELIDWSRQVLGASINEFYGQTECNMIISCCSALEPITPGVMGRAVAGHQVDIINPDTGIRLDDAQEGAIAVRAPDPVMFLGYWNNEQATREKFVEGPDGQWLLTGDRGIRQSSGKFKFVGRDDDVIGSAGYRIGPAEIEDCLIKHPAVELAGVVGKPDELRGTVVAAYLTLVEGALPSESLAEEIADFVKTQLAAHEYPRVVRFLEHMPTTTTGKIVRAALRQLAKAEFQQEQENT